MKQARKELPERREGTREETPASMLHRGQEGQRRYPLTEQGGSGLSEQSNSPRESGCAGKGGDAGKEAGDFEEGM